MKKKIIYVLITPARNEEAYIEKTIQSVISQTILPNKWIIVSDGSTDRTDEIVRQYTEKYSWIELLRMPEHKDHNFASKVKAFNVGYEKVKNIKYYFIGNLDADVSFEPNYYESIIAKFHNNYKLGIAGGKAKIFHNGTYLNLVSSPWSVGGAIQFFRRKCFEEIGGYVPIERGGEDTIAEIMARMHGWEVKGFPDICILHHGQIGIAKGNILFGRFNQGSLDYSFGYHPIYMVVKFFNRIKENPFFLSSLFRISGYFFALLRRESRVLPKGVVKYLRLEQMQRLKSNFLKFTNVKNE